MSDCVLFGLLVGREDYVSKDGVPGTNFVIRSASGKLYNFRTRTTFPDFGFDVPVTVEFDINFFNGTPTRTVLRNLSLTKKKGE